MTKRFAIFCSVLLAAAAALFTVFCTDVEFNNPIDDQGTNCLPCKDADPDVPGQLDSMLRMWYDTTKGPDGNPINQKWQCDRTPIELELKGNYGETVSLEYDPERKDFRGEETFKRLMGIDYGILDVVGVKDWGRTGRGNITCKLTDGSFNEVSYTGMPRPRPGEEESGTKYLILYTADKTTGCDSTFTAQITREIIVRNFITEDLVRPTITLNGKERDTVYVGDNIIDYGAVANDPAATTGNNLNHLIKRTLKKGNTVVHVAENGGSVRERIDNSEPGVWTIEYEVCKTLRHSDGREEPACVSTSRTIIIEKKIVVEDDPVAVIVLKTYTFRIDGKDYKLRDTTFVQGGSFRDAGIEEAYYMDGGRKVPIGIDLVQQGANPSGSSRGEKEKTYTLEAVPGEYKAPERTIRKLFVTTPRECDDDGEGNPDFTKPNINFVRPSNEPSTPTTGALPIAGNIRWGDNEALRYWAVAEQDISNFGWRLGVHFGTLNQYNTQTGETHTVTFVGISACSDGRYPDGNGSSRSTPFVTRDREIKVGQ